jgi:hypothetical protein
MGLYNPDGITVNYSFLAQNLLQDGVDISDKDTEKNYDTFFDTKVLDITPK